MNSGSYNVSIPRNSRRPVSNDTSSESGCIFDGRGKYFCCFLAVLLLVFVCLAGFIIWSSTTRSPDDYSECFLNTTSVEQQLYFKYSEVFHKSYDNFEDECTAFASFLNRLEALSALYKRSDASAVFGPTSFTDWDTTHRIGYGGNTITDLSFRISKKVWKVDIDTLPAELIFPVGNVRFFDECSISWNVRWALTRLAEVHDTAKKLKEEDYVFDESCPVVTNAKMLPVREIESSDSSARKSGQYFESWMYFYGPFATSLTVSDLFFDYAGGVFRKQNCVEGDMLTLVHVIVTGYGFDKDTSTRFWMVMPIGEKWRQWGMNGQMKLEIDACVTEGVDLKLITAGPEHSFF